MFCGLHRLRQLQKETLFKYIYSIHQFIPKTTFKTTHASIIMVSRTERFTKKFCFSPISFAACKKKVWGSCTHNFDATDLPNSQFELLYPKVFRGTLKVDLVSFRRRPAPSKVSISEKLSIIFGVFRFFLDKIEFPGQTVNFCLQHVLHILKAIDLMVHLSYQETFVEHPTRRHIFANTVQPHITQDQTFCLSLSEVVKSCYKKVV